MEQKKIVMIAGGAVAIVGIATLSWFLIFGKNGSAGKSGDIPVGLSAESGTEVPVNAFAQDQPGQQPAQDPGSASQAQPDMAVVVPAPDVKTKADATKALTDLDSLVNNAGTPTE